MTPISFSFGNAMSHFQKTDGPKGFVWKFGLAYGLAVVLLQVISFWLIGPMYAAMFDPDLIGNDAAMEAALAESIGQIMIGYLVITVLGVLLWMMFEAASQRRYMRGEGFALRLGADEFRLFVVALIWVGIAIALYIGMLIAVVVPFAAVAATGGEEGVILGALLMFVLMIAYSVFALWFCAKFSAASALTIRDRSIEFGRSWRVTRGKAWTIVGSWIVLMLIMMVIAMVLYFVLIVAMFAAIFPAVSGMDPSEAEDPAFVFSMILSPAFLLPAAIVGVGYAFLQGVFLHVMGGPAALAARTDPDWADGAGLTETFS